MKIRNVADTRFADPGDKWYDPHNLIFVGDDSRYAEGPFYAVHGRIISGILRSGLVPRLGGPEGALNPRTPLHTGLRSVAALHLGVLLGPLQSRAHWLSFGAGPSAVRRMLQRGVDSLQRSHSAR